MSRIVRTATADDAERLLEIYGYYVEKTAISFEYDVPSIAEFRNRIENILLTHPYLVGTLFRTDGYRNIYTRKPREAAGLMPRLPR